jgi:glutaconate CoA-transferase subunit B
VLESVHQTSSLEEVKANTGFDINVDNAAVTVPPSLEEIAALSRIDPNDLRSCEFAK